MYEHDGWTDTHTTWWHRPHLHSITWQQWLIKFFYKYLHYNKDNAIHKTSSGCFIKWIRYQTTRLSWNKSCRMVLLSLNVFSNKRAIPSTKTHHKEPISVPQQFHHIFNGHFWRLLNAEERAVWRMFLVLLSNYHNSKHDISVSIKQLSCNYSTNAELCGWCCFLSVNLWAWWQLMNAFTDDDQTWQAWETGDTLEVIKFWCCLESGCGCTITFPLRLTLRDTAWFLLARGCSCLGKVCTLWAYLVNPLMGTANCHIEWY